jgi:hypothetical protein
MLASFGLVTIIWYVTQQVKFAPSANPKKPWRTLNISFRPMHFEDKTLDDNVKYARHAISIDENRAAFQRVGWGDPHGARPDKDALGIDTFQQYWLQVITPISVAAMPKMNRGFLTSRWVG